MKLLRSVDISLPVTRNTKDPSGLSLTWQILLYRTDGSEEREVDEHESLRLVAFKTTNTIEHAHTHTHTHTLQLVMNKAGNLRLCSKSDDIPIIGRSRHFAE